MSTIIIAEAGVNHNGDLNTALKLCDSAKAAGADVVKFQTWITEKIITRTVEQAEYQTKNIGRKQSQFDMLKELELSYSDFKRIKKYCDDIGIVFASTADEEESLDFLIDLGIPFIKIGSGDICNIPFLRAIGSKKLPVILSTGMSTILDVDTSIKAIREGGADDITLLHCTTNYPCPYEDVNLRAMKTLQEEFHLPVGYSDHTVGIKVPVAAVAMGACVIEKHFTLDRNMDGPDHAASTEPEEFKKMVDEIRDEELFLGDGVKRPSKQEIEIKNVITKRIVASEKITKGDVISPEMVCIKRSMEGEPAIRWDYVIGQVATKDYDPEEGIVVNRE